VAAYYNEIDSYCCDWLSNLMDAGYITPGVICDKSIEDVFPDELRKFDRCHFFAGIGVWDYALNMARWGERPVWTGSAPCQPFSAAGKGAGFDDERHLWPAWYWLIGECRPPIIFGEQVASGAVDPWIDLVHADMEALDYPFGCVPFPSAGVGSPHIRDRAYWMAYAPELGWREECADPGRVFARNRTEGVSARSLSGRSTCNWLPFRDGKERPVEPGTFPLVDGAPSRVGRLRAYGNAINASAAQAFIEVAMECIR
jgi:DNA (cytosine-5)-methyltransferase 1